MVTIETGKVKTCCLSVPPFKTKSNNNLTETYIEGCIEYDSYSGNTRGNARECLEKQSTGMSAEFEMDEPYPLLEGCQSGKPYLITRGQDRRYLIIDEGVKVEAKIEYKEGFGDRTKIITPDMETEPDGILGYPASVPRERDPMYDLVLFFKEANITGSFFEGLGWKGCPKSEYYVKPEGFKSVYSRDESITMPEEVDGSTAYPKYKIKVEEGKAEDIFKEVNGVEAADNKELELGKPVHAVMLTIGETAACYYYGFKVNKKTYYVRGDGKGPQGLGKKNYLDMLEHLIIMERGGEENSISCDHTLIEEAIKEEKHIFEEFLKLFTNNSEEGLTKRERLRRVICKHHLEWNEGLYDTAFSEAERVSGEYLECRVLV